MIAFSRLLLRVELLHAFPLPCAFSFPFELLPVCTRVDVMHEERSFITYDSSIVLTWNIAAKCQETDKDWKQLPQCGKAIVSVTTWFEMRLNATNTFYIKSPPPVCLVKRRLAPVSWRHFSLQENFLKALPVQSALLLFRRRADCLQLLLFCSPAASEGSAGSVCPPADGQHRPVSCEASLWQIPWPGVAAQLGRHGEELPDSPSKSRVHRLLHSNVIYSPAETHPGVM